MKNKWNFAILPTKSLNCFLNHEQFYSSKLISLVELTQMLVRLCLAFDIFTFFDAQHIQFIKNNIVRILDGGALDIKYQQENQKKEMKIEHQKILAEKLTNHFEIQIQNL